MFKKLLTGALTSFFFVSATSLQAQQQHIFDRQFSLQSFICVSTEVLTKTFEELEVQPIFISNVEQLQGQLIIAANQEKFVVVVVTYDEDVQQYIACVLFTGEQFSLEQLEDNKKGEKL